MFSVFRYTQTSHNVCKIFEEKNSVFNRYHVDSNLTLMNAHLSLFIFYFTIHHKIMFKKTNF